MGCTASLRMLRPTQIERLMDLYRNSHSPNLYLRHGGPKVWTERRSIQGLRQPSVEGMFKALKFARLKNWGPRNFRGLKYSGATLQLTTQHLAEARGRCGEQKPYAKGFDRHILEGVFNEPFLAGTPPRNAA